MTSTACDRSALRRREHQSPASSSPSLVVRDLPGMAVEVADAPRNPRRTSSRAHGLISAPRRRASLDDPVHLFAGVDVVGQADAAAHVSFVSLSRAQYAPGLKRRPSPGCPAQVTTPWPRRRPAPGRSPNRRGLDEADALLHRLGRSASSSPRRVQMGHSALVSLTGTAFPRAAAPLCAQLQPSLPVPCVNPTVNGFTALSAVARR